MKLKFHSDKPGGPCKHMEGLLNSAAEGSSSGWQRWYALAHALRCSRCRKYLESLEAMIARLKSQRERPLSDDLRARLEQTVRQASLEVE